MSINFSRFFLRGPKNSLRLANGVHFAYQGPWVAATSNTVIDSWYVSEFMAAEYTVVIDVTPTRKEIIKALVIAGPSTAAVTVYGRTHLGENLFDLTATVTDSKMTLLANPSSSPDGSTYDNSSLLLGGKIIFSAVYYHSINELKRSPNTSTYTPPPTYTPLPTTPTPPLTPVSTYTVTPAVNNINEGSALAINVATTNVTDGTTLYWSVNNTSDFVVSSGSFTITSNAGVFTVTPAADATTEGAETFIASIRTGSISGTVVATTSNITINDISTTPLGTIYNVTVASGSNGYGAGNKYYISGFAGASPTVNLAEGNTYVFRQSDSSNTTHLLLFSTTANGTWGAGTEYITGVTKVGVAGQPGAYTQITVAIGAPTLYYYCINHTGMGGTANTPGAGTPVYNSVTSPSNVNEGSVATFTVSTQNIVNGTTIGYTITGISAGDLSLGSLTGNITINSNTGSVSVTLANDVTTEGAETMTLTLAGTDSAGTSTGSLSSDTIVNDTSTSAPTYTVTPAVNNINEGSALAINVATTDVANATTLYWTVTNSGDFVVSSGSFTITSNTGAFTVTPTADLLTEGAETFTVSVRTGSVSGTIVATSGSVTINDTSTTPVVSPSYTINVSAVSSSAYILSGSDRAGSVSGNNPALTFNNGDTVSFVVNASGHPFWLKTSAIAGTGNAISSGVTNNGTQSGTVQWTVGSTGTFYYICQFHSGMVNAITIL